MLQFTGHERDAATLGDSTLPDYMHARFYEAGWRRFLSVDPVIDVKVAMTSPQAWNRYSYVRNNPLDMTDPTGMIGCKVDGKQIDCRIVVVYDKQKNNGALYLVGTTGKGKDKKDQILLQGTVVVGRDGKTPTGTFTASYWEKDHVSNKYGWQADKPWSKSPRGLNAFGPFQLHLKELEKRGIWIHGTMGPDWIGNARMNCIVSLASHGCVRCSNPMIIKLREMMPEPGGNRVTISTNPADAPDDDQ
jgi:RHS repeat-associated protein